MPHLTPEQVIDQLDWPLLDQQRLRLGELLESERLSSEYREAIEGLLAFLDALTDAAHDAGLLSRP